MALGFAALNGSRWLFPLIPLNIIIVGWNNYLVGSWGYDYELLTTGIGTLIFTLGCGVFWAPKYQQVLKSPHLRWWMVAKRVALRLPVDVSPFRGKEFSGKTVDISQTGAFIESHEDLLKLGEMIDLNLKLNSLHHLQVQAEVVRKSEDNSKFAVQFHNLATEEKKLLSKFVH